MNHIQQLQQVYPPSEARAIYRLVMETRFGLNQTDILLGKDTQLSEESQSELEKIIGRLLTNEPVQYVLGECEFCGHTFHVEPGVLIPRPETEELVACVCRHMPPETHILDLGTGSGCIAVSLALRGYHVSALDLSPIALEIASGNARALHAEVEFIQENILHPSVSDRQWDALVSNPPYICESEASSMQPNVLEYEPSMALFVPDDDPLRFYRAIVDFARTHLRKQGKLFFEINRAFSNEIVQLLEESGFRNVECRKDQFGNDRIVLGTYEGNDV